MWRMTRSHLNREWSLTWGNCLVFQPFLQVLGQLSGLNINQNIFRRNPYHKFQASRRILKRILTIRCLSSFWNGSRFCTFIESKRSFKIWMFSSKKRIPVISIVKLRHWIIIFQAADRINEILGSVIPVFASYLSRAIMLMFLQL